MTIRPKLHIRTFEPCDQAAVRRLILSGLGDHFGRIDETLNPDVDDIMSSYVDPGNHFIVAEIDGELVGAGGLVAEGPNLGRIVRMSVAGEHRRKGIGRALLTHLLDSARRRGYSRGVVETNHDWEDAVSFYKSYGFAEYARDDVSVYLSLGL